MQPEDTKDSDPNDLYPSPTEGPLSDDHSKYAKEPQWAGEDPDRHMRTYFIIFIIILVLLFFWAITMWTGRGLFNLWFS